MFNHSIKLLIKNTLIFSLIAILIMFVLAAFMLFITFDYSTIDIITQIIKTVIVFLCGWRAAKLIGKAGFLYGGISGLALTLLIYIISLIIVQTTPSLKHFFLELLFGTAFGIGGGIVGINVIKSTKK